MGDVAGEGDLDFVLGALAEKASTFEGFGAFDEAVVEERVNRRCHDDWIWTGIRADDMIGAS